MAIITEIPNIAEETKALHQQLQTHSMYAHLTTVEKLQVFMEHHIFAVWDFMSLVKALQMQLTTVQTPWVPSAYPKLSRFINEIVFEEESDLNELGEPKSHFEMYRDAMLQIGASTQAIDTLIHGIHEHTPMEELIQNLDVDSRIKAFMNFTFQVIATQKPHCIAAAFAFGREHVIPDMFTAILSNANTDPQRISKFKYYLERHIALDGEEHGPLALQMISTLCGEEIQKWDEAIHIAKQALEKRIALWDAVYETFQS